MKLQQELVTKILAASEHISNHNRRVVGPSYIVIPTPNQYNYIPVKDIDLVGKAYLNIIYQINRLSRDITSVFYYAGLRGFNQFNRYGEYGYIQISYDELGIGISFDLDINSNDTIKISIYGSDNPDLVDYIIRISRHYYYKVNSIGYTPVRISKMNIDNMVGRRIHKVFEELNNMLNNRILS
jgi:hypothetical protein